MKTINVKPVEIIGDCDAHLTLDDEFQIEGMKLKNPGQSALCLRALSHLPSRVLLLQSEEHFFAHLICPDCLSRLDQTICVVFLLGHADKWELCQAISEHNRLRRQGKEPVQARKLRLEAIEHQKLGEYPEATRKMKAALKELKHFVAFSSVAEVADTSITIPTPGSDTHSPQPGSLLEPPPSWDNFKLNGSTWKPIPK